ncbi:MAG: DASS family sodium-coupled anion symporter [Bryobacteraceae bacterium]|nr:DASS family sodium-coupled anion symporter [Bryobacteraceae bacterium]
MKIPRNRRVISEISNFEALRRVGYIHSVSMQNSSAEPQPNPARGNPIRGLVPLVLLYCAIVYLVPRPAAIDPAGWRLFGLFAATVAGLILQPVPGGALVLMAVTLTPVLAGLTISQALSGFGDTTVWLVMAAFFISRSLINTGLARRIALFFVKLFGTNSLGVCYALSLSDAILATIIPSNGARTGGVILPIVRSISELYGSSPGATAPLLGSYLFTAVYQSICVSAAMFYTGQASNPLAAKIAGNIGYEVTWTSWFLAGLVPGLVSLAVIPWVVMRLNPPQIRKTPEAAKFARRELENMGPLSKNEWILAGVFVGVCSMWVTSGLHGIDITVTALFGSVTLLLAGVLTWEDVKNERAAWDIFIWYGGLLMLGKALNEAKVTTEFARLVASGFENTGWPVLFVAALLIYFYAHYGFASITAHLLAMYPPFLAVLLAKGAPPGLLVYAFACFANLSAGLTNYGTTPSPMFFAHDYVSLKTWWKIGFAVSLVNILIWGTIGFGWWKVLRIW